MAKGWVTEVMGKAGGGHDGSQLLDARPGKGGVATDDVAGHVAAERHSDTRHFKGVGEAVVDEDAAWQGEDLRLVLKAAEGGGEDKAVVVALKL